MSLLTQLEDEAAAGWPKPWWPQDDPRVRTQRLPERCRHGHDLAEFIVWRRSPKTVTYGCRRCDHQPAAVRTHCKRGHPQAGNTVGPRRRCRTCCNQWNLGLIWPGQTEEQYAEIAKELAA